MSLQLPMATGPLRDESASERANAKPAARPRLSPPRVSATDASAPPGPSDGALPPEMSVAKEWIAGGVAYVFRHHELGLLGRIVVQDITGGQCLVSLEVAGDPEDPMTDRRMTIFEPVAKDLVGRLERHRGRIEHVLGTSPPVTPPDIGELVESKLIPCERCDAGVALLIFTPGATDPGRFEDYARRMYKQVVQLNVPTYVIGPALGDGAMMDRPADILKIWPKREPMQRFCPDEFNLLLDQLAQTHCSGGSARQALDRMQEAGELHDQGTRWHRGQLCLKCFFYRRISDADEACNAYGKWLINPPVQREQCEQFISR